ncbi:hypothetical protein [Ramlibacter sp.]|uniref:hypothetical protein n=1 Tax=Ramlibacter sp. TaxID=1917967 RepID=UPI003D0B5B74
MSDFSTRMTQEAQVIPVTCSLMSGSAAVFMGCLEKWFDPGHRQGSNDGKVNTHRRFCLLRM